MFYDINKTLTYNCLFNFIVGNRGGGKTFAFKDWAIRDFKKNKQQFIYLRRYKEELKEVSTFFDDIREFYPNDELVVKHNKFYINGELAGYAKPLSTAKISKSTSFPKVNKIGFDEFIIEKGVYHYLPDEVVLFLEFYETVARMRDVRVFFLSNAVTMTNPYFLYFKLSLPYNKNIYRKDDLLLEFVANPDFIEKKKSTRFGKIIANTKYADYSIDNKFYLDNKLFIQKKSPNCRFSFAFIYKGETYGVWTDYSIGKIFVSLDWDRSTPLIFSTTLDDHTPNTMLLKSPNKSNLWRLFIKNFKMSNVYFENIKIKNVCMDLLKMILT